MDKIEKKLAQIRRWALRARNRDTYGRFDVEKVTPRTSALNVRLTEAERELNRRGGGGTRDDDHAHGC